jgi:hypothetical protein
MKENWEGPGGNKDKNDKYLYNKVGRLKISINRIRNKHNGREIKLGEGERKISSNYY